MHRPSTFQMELALHHHQVATKSIISLQMSTLECAYLSSGTKPVLLKTYSKDVVFPAQDSLQMSCMFGVGYLLAFVWLVILFFKKNIFPGSLSRLVEKELCFVEQVKHVSTHG